MTCVYEAFICKYHWMARHRLFLNGVAWADKKKKQIYEKRERAQGRESFRKKKRNKKRRFKQASPNKSPFFFHSPNAVMNIFCLRTCGQPENKVTETEKGGKIAPIVLPSTARFICFNRPKNKNASLTIVQENQNQPAFLHTLDIERCLHCNMS